jgi:hypothetical protein
MKKLSLKFFIDYKSIVFNYYFIKKHKIRKTQNPSQIKFCF